MYYYKCLDLEICPIISKNLLIGVQGTQTPAGNSGRVETPQPPAARRLNSAPRKAKCLERKSTAPIQRRRPY
ncbi:hypothetical protein EVU96_13030 [Bacillus infantis]|nr:hypothetical protein EVU96_13030 [Bacillus infantis]